MATVTKIGSKKAKKQQTSKQKQAFKKLVKAGKQLLFQVFEVNWEYETQRIIKLLRESGALLAYIDLFCGAGGTSTGMEEAMFLEKKLACVILGINHDRVAIESHQANHPETLHLIEDIREVNLEPITKLVEAIRRELPYIKIILWDSADCFVAGTLILTTNGLVPIENIKIGDKVLTHKNRWKRVTRTMHSEQYTSVIKGQGIHLETTDNHPFYQSNIKNIWNNPRRSYDRTIGDIHWTHAKNLQRNDLLASPNNIRSLPIPKVGGFDFSKNFWWLVGRWLGDGSLGRPERGEITISCGKHEYIQLREQLKVFNKHSKRAAKNEIKFKGRGTTTAYNFDSKHKALYAWLKKYFGVLAHGKRLPAFVWGMPAEWRSALLGGYKSADGSFNGRLNEASSVSKNLAIGIKILAQTLGYGVNYYLPKFRNNPIEGRIVDSKQQYCIKWVETPKQSEALHDEIHTWNKFRKRQPTGQLKTVYNLSVEEDESYVADGIVVHNCTHHSKAKGGDSRDPDSRSLSEELYRYDAAILPDLIQIENVTEFRSWGPIIQKTIDVANYEFDSMRKMSHPEYGRLFSFNGKTWVNRYGKAYKKVKRKGIAPWMVPDPKRKAEYFNRWVAHIKSLGYIYEDRDLNSADYGAYTARRRYFGQFARISSAMPIIWPQITHAKHPDKYDVEKYGKLQPYKAVRDVLDFSDKGESIFVPGRITSPQTFKRILQGCIKFIAGGKKEYKDASEGYEDFLMKYNSTSSDGVGVKNSSVSVDEPAPTVATQDRIAKVHVEKGDEVAFMQSYHNGIGTKGTQVHSVDEPNKTVDTQNRFAFTSVEFITKYFSGKPEYKNIPITGPAGTVKCKDGQALVIADLLPFIVQFNNNCDANSVDEPSKTITQKEKFGLAGVEQLHFIQQRNSGNPESKVTSVDAPARTITSTGGNQELVEANKVHFIQASNGGNPSSKIASVDDPSRTITTGDNKALVEIEQILPFIAVYHGNGDNCHSVTNPSPVVAANDGMSVVSPRPFIMRYFSQGGGQLNDVNGPAGGITTIPKMHLVSHETADAWLLNPSFDNVGTSVDTPAHTILAGRKHAYIVNPSYGGNCSDVEQPSPVVVARQDKSPLHLCQVEYGDTSFYAIVVYTHDCEEIRELKQFMAAFNIVDIKMRMLKVLELLRIQGFPATYILKGSQTDQKKFVGNSVEVRTARKLAECYGPYLTTNYNQVAAVA
jgi:DNA (cytosine-5)-methyltransferase 1